LSFFETIALWIESREGLLSGLAALVVVTGVFLSPLGKILKRLPFLANRRVKTTNKDGEETFGAEANQLSSPGKVKLHDGVSLIVLPLQTISAEPSDSVLSDAIHEDLTTQLARVDGYFVISRTTALVYRDQIVSMKALRDELGVRYALEGSIRRAGDHVRITAQLIDTETEGHIWAHGFDRPVDQLVDLQNDLIAEIVTHLGSELNLAEVRRIDHRLKTNPTALDHFNRSKSAIYQHGWNKRGIAESTACIEQAVAVDPDYAPAVSQLALLKGIAGTYGYADKPFANLKQDVIDLAERALELDHQSSDVLGFAGCALSDVGETDRGVVHLQRATELDPSNAQAWAAYGWARILQGRAEEGVPMMEAATRISPKQSGLAFWLNGLAMGQESLKRYDAAKDSLERAIRFDPKFPGSYPLLAALVLADGNKSYAEELIRRARDVGPDGTAASMRAGMPPHLFKRLIQSGILEDMPAA